MKRKQAAWVTIAVVATCYLLFLGYSIAVAEDPTGVGGVREPDGLEGVGVLVSIVAFPFVAGAIALIYLVGIRDRTTGRGTQRNPVPDEDSRLDAMRRASDRREWHDSGS